MNQKKGKKLYVFNNHYSRMNGKKDFVQEKVYADTILDAKKQLRQKGVHGLF